MAKSEGRSKFGRQHTHYKGYSFITITDKGPPTKFQRAKSEYGTANLFNF